MVLHSTEIRGGSGGGGSGSSIALLQERFRQLQRMREKRQEMELLKLFPEPETMSQTSQTNRYEPLVRSLVHPDMTKTRSSFQDSAPLGLNLYTNQAEPKKPAKTTQFMDFWQVDSKKHEVDTSLHL
ncbi:hypothetical protein L1987_40042 [Smallanthus sonchifolius]|uniref:Uncharacterized protein n=1 Tax=Smallanthus sonchifolius TaxID=185202 RepID=A0ACB9GSJ2_9ASTR|nr:hypothetical protein L1987_40042 [Smallanthus sonchifolius]